MSEEDKCTCQPLHLALCGQKPGSSNPHGRMEPVCNCGPPSSKCSGEEPKMASVSFKNIKRFYTDCLVASGVIPEFASIEADVLFDADERGNTSNGIGRLESLCYDLKSKKVSGKQAPAIIYETPSLTHVDGKNGLGGVVGKFCIDLAIKKAQMCGVSLVIAKHSTNFGCCAFYTEMCIKNDLLGFCCTNSRPIVIPTRAKEVTIGSNPMSFGAPINIFESFLLDMFTSVTSRNEIEKSVQTGAKLPEGMVQKGNGEAETNPVEALKHLRLLPFGSEELFGSQKGYGLGLMVDILCGVLSGGEFGPKLKKDKFPRENGHCFIVINPNQFNRNFKGDLQELTDHIRNLEPIDGRKEPIPIPGDDTRDRRRKQIQTQKIEYYSKYLQSCKNLAKELKVKPLIDD